MVIPTSKTNAAAGNADFTGCSPFLRVRNQPKLGDLAYRTHQKQLSGH
jgi:hypothetical protein